VFPELTAVDDSDTEEHQYDWNHESKSKRHSPDTVVDALTVCCKHYQCDYSGHHKAEVDTEICAHGDEDTALATDIRRLITGLYTSGSASRVFSSSAKSSDTASDDHHPEHAKVGSAVSSCGDDDAEDEKQGRKDDSSSATDFVDHVTEEEHAEDLADEVRVTQTSLDCAAETRVGIEDAEKGVPILYWYWDIGVRSAASLTTGQTHM